MLHSTSLLTHFFFSRSQQREVKRDTTYLVPNNDKWVFGISGFDSKWGPFNTQCGNVTSLILLRLDCQVRYLVIVAINALFQKHFQLWIAHQKYHLNTCMMQGSSIFMQIMSIFCRGFFSAQFSRCYIWLMFNWRSMCQNAKFRHIFQTFQAHISEINAHFPMKIDQGNV